MKKYAYSLFSSTVCFLMSANASLADTAPTTSTGIVGSLACAGADGRNCSLNDFVQVGISVVKLIYALAGSLALLYFIYGGIMWVISGGNPDRVKKGQDAIKNAVIGLVIIFASYMIINFVMTSLGYKMNGAAVWNTTPS
jgi:hypothetical protein